MGIKYTMSMHQQQLKADLKQINSEIIYVNQQIKIIKQNPKGNMFSSRVKSLRINSLKADLTNLFKQRKLLEAQIH
ncbi:hypothetical protein [Dahlia mosaic virus]|uniref:Uncharacterized protein n=1 Tax=Dahlia mosaic virus TaxID=213888 RepID=J9UN18_DMV|nr:hypothetical protein [Dahlia mosaic virus]AFR69285.1 hypothetical protein [Dahlia mosaic virus]